MNDKTIHIQQVTKSPSVEIYLPDDRVLCGPRNSPVEHFLRALPEWGDPPITGAVVNGELRELTYAIEMEANVKPVTMMDADGARIYRRSLTFLLEAAFQDLFPQHDLTVDHSVDTGGFFCHVEDRRPLDRSELKALEDHMHELVEADLAFTRQKVPLQEVVEYFQSRGETDKLHLLKYRQKEHLVLYRLKEYRDYHHGYMVPSTGYLKWFSLTPMGEGFVLRFPRRHLVTKLLPLPSSPTLLETFRQYGRWLDRLGIGSVGALNDAIYASRIREIILVSEALHEQRIAEIAAEIVEKGDKARVILVAGPSSSGKTTFSKRLSIQLLAQGISPFALELDNYFVDRENTPRDENGALDYEALGAVNIALLNDHIRRLLAGDEVQLPRFNFKTGKSEPGEVMRLFGDQSIILEGIHGLNPQLLPSIAHEQSYRIYISSLTQLNLDRHNRISTTDNRLIRRIVRDARERGYTAQQTIQRWESVRRGEKRHIFPYQENANVMFNSALVYEVSALRPLAEPLLRQVPYGTPEHIEAKRLLAFLDWFLTIETDLIPDNSILREFIGSSILQDFKLWDSQQNIRLVD